MSHVSSIMKTLILWEMFTPAGSVQTRLLCLLYCEITIATWCLTFWLCLFPICLIQKPRLPSERECRRSSQSAAGESSLKNTRGKATVDFFLLLSFRLVFVWSEFGVLSSFLLMFDVVWLRHLQRLPTAHSLSSVTKLSCHPGERDMWSAHAARDTHGEDYSTGFYTC